MNRIHKTLWNARLGAHVAVSEAAPGRGRSSSATTAARAAVAAFALTAIAAAAQQAPGVLPTGGTVTAGQASIQAQGNALTVTQGSQRAAINWQSFSIGSGASVTFAQPDAAAVILNRVVGTERSVIDGALRANGQVWLLNANGILFGRTAQVDAAGLVASTLDISDADFMAGRSQFSANGSRAGVINLGQLRAADAGHVALLGSQVVNEGVITARLGAAVLAAGDKVSLNFNGSSLVGVTVDRGVLDAMVANKQAILADGGLVVLTARGLDDVMSTVVNNTGEIRAQTVADKEGRIYLLGGLQSDAIQVGGRLDASAPQGGHGGFVETSAARVGIAADATVTTRAAAGTHGQWLIDPEDFVIGAGGDISGAALGAALANGNVTIETAVGGASCTGVAGCGAGTAGNGDILVRESIAKTAGGDTSLTLKAHNSIVLDAGVSIGSTAGKLDVLLSANNGGGNAASITLAADAAVATNGGNLVLGGALAAGVPSNDRLVDITLGTGVALAANGGRVDLFGKDVDVGANTHVDAARITADVANLSFGNNPGIQWTATDAVAVRATGQVNLSGAYRPPAGSAYITPASQTSVNAGNTMTIEAADSLNINSAAIRLTNAAGPNALTLRAGDAVTVEDSSVAFAGRADLRILVKQNATQSDLANVDPATTTVAAYRDAHQASLYDVAQAADGLNVDGSHFGLAGGGYKLQVYSDTALTQVTTNTIDNGLLAIGNGLTDSVNAAGNLRQPFYFDPTLAQWMKLTYWNYDMDMAVGVGGSSTSGWNNAGTVLSTDRGNTSLAPAISGLSVDASGLGNGVGVVRVAYDVTAPVTGETLRMTHDYSLAAGDRFVKAVTRTINTGAAAADNVRMWVGTRDDYVAISDANVKTKGNITANGFEAITTASQQARSIIISEFNPSTAGTPGSAVLFHSTNIDADTVTDRCCSFGNVVNKDPRVSQVVTPVQDGSYGIFMNYGSMAAGATRQVTWYYGAAPLSAIGTLVDQVVAGGGTEIVAPTVVTVPGTPPAPVVVAQPPVPVPVPVSPVIENVVAQTITVSLPAALPAAPEPVRTAGPVPGQVVSLPHGAPQLPGAAGDLLVTPTLDGDTPNTAVSLSQAREMLGAGQEGAGASPSSTSSSPASASTGSATSSASSGTASQGSASEGTVAGSDRMPGASAEVRVPASRNSRVHIVNGGVRLPGGVEQQLFVIRK
ncbi:MAG TPA: filamentous hemagglutinin N-terminal domain-containing protein [Ramlibacter sp.]|jgi:filamentous hemagglutinin family protein|uniref:two-partner secretion domain-containing protein n=1 Tax=Ramlibacter sp. TaxID=1917967 RepID=UPI002D544257|nr:filamentous hemagglutinin N-terminal domain-containing protein [Ramlibacter sp.]HZY19064.1 filamentous hemagglutinin N-terminal domain-containing protein [Ramlibacter sp.]